MNDTVSIEANAEGRIPRGDLEIAVAFGRAEAIPLYEDGELVAFQVYHPNGVAIGYVHLDDELISYERRDGDGDEVEGETPLGSLRLAVQQLVESEGPNPFLGALGYECAAGHADCAHLSAGPCHRQTANVLACPAGDCAGQTGPEED